MADVEYFTYITATAERVWDTLTDPESTARFWGHSNVSGWVPGDRWEHTRTDGSGVVDVAGTVVVSDRPRVLALTFEPDDSGDTGVDADDPAVATLEIAQFHDIVRLTISHTGVPEEAVAITRVGWASVAANLKTLLETGDVMPQPPWEMPG